MIAVVPVQAAVALSAAPELGVGRRRVAPWMHEEGVKVVVEPAWGEDLSFVHPVVCHRATRHHASRPSCFRWVGANADCAGLCL